jgi:hypothetical protein
VSVDWHAQCLARAVYLGRRAHAAALLRHDRQRLKMQNTVSSYLFDDNQQLNAGGCVRWIVTQAPCIGGRVRAEGRQRQRRQPAWVGQCGSHRMPAARAP